MARLNDAANEDICEEFGLFWISGDKLPNLAKRQNSSGSARVSLGGLEVHAGL